MSQLAKVYIIFFEEKFGGKEKMTYLNRNREIARVLSSVGSEHLVYTQRVGGSTPSGPTTEGCVKRHILFSWQKRREICYFMLTFVENK